MYHIEVMDSIKNTYLRNHQEKTLQHAENVANTAVWLANLYGLDANKAKLAALLHDISAIMTPQEMYELAAARGMEIDPAEEKHHFLLHQRISRLIAQELFHICDPDILDAIECHTTLRKNANLYDMVIFIADKLSWDQEGVPPYWDLVKSKVAESIEDACYCFIKYQFDNALLLMPHRWIIEAYEDLKHSENRMENSAR